jgi:predicted lipid-binding transport protein (Tim44 family)
MNYEKSRTKSFIGGLVIGVLVGALIGGFAMSAVLGTAFIDYANSHPIQCQNVKI